MRKKYEYISIHVSILILHLIYYFGILFLADEGNYLLVSNLECGVKNSSTKYTVQMKIELKPRAMINISFVSFFAKWLSPDISYKSYYLVYMHLYHENIVIFISKTNEKNSQFNCSNQNLGSNHYFFI